MTAYLTAVPLLCLLATARPQDIGKINLHKLHANMVPVAVVLYGFKNVHLSGVEFTQMGQQLVAGSYPVHFHLAGDVDEAGGYSRPTYVRDLSIHHCFSRCVTIHSTHGLLVQDTVGYDTLGHCFFLEDGNEQRNVLDHNLGLVTRPGTLLPSDRDVDMCRGLTGAVYGGYMPNPGKECRGVSTFWIAHPNNVLTNNAAAGSAEVGIWYIFHDEPTGLSAGSLPRKQAERTPLGRFYNNRVHSNAKRGFMIDDRVKTTPASARAPQEYLSLGQGQGYFPHQNADLQQPREPAMIEGLIAYKNLNGEWIRGGDIWHDRCAFVDNGVGLTMARVFPMRGLDYYDGPTLARSCTFKKYASAPEYRRYSSAIGWRLTNDWHMSPKNNATNLKFEDVQTRVFTTGENIPYMSNDRDGDKNQVFHDLDGSVTGYPDTYVVRQDNYMVKNPGCVDKPEWRASICSGELAQVLFVAKPALPRTMTIVRDEYPDQPMTMAGARELVTKFYQPEPIIFDAALRFLEVTVVSAGWEELQLGHSPYIEINGVRYDHRTRGYLVLGVDAVSGTITHQSTFNTHSSNTDIDLRMANFIRNDIPINSIVVVSVRDRSSRYAQECLVALKEIGAAEPVATDDKGNFAMVGFKGTVWPSWVQQVNLPSGQGPAQIYTKVPLMG
uniref:Uncharacterized protein n=1 Tax=Branchiostoma floridae TaxID=7739 RepID=C3ZTW5_BRAFL|eukprot:XP_002587996.1 hypothetical protein BRAFLDRAFT_125397 [Branchiostoma floridae]